MIDLPDETRAIGYWLLRKEYMKNYKLGIFDHLRMYIFANLPLDQYIFLLIFIKCIASKGKVPFWALFCVIPQKMGIIKI